MASNLPKWSAVGARLFEVAEKLASFDDDITVVQEDIEVYRQSYAAKASVASPSWRSNRAKSCTSGTDSMRDAPGLSQRARLAKTMIERMKRSEYPPISVRRDVKGKGKAASTTKKVLRLGRIDDSDLDDDDEVEDGEIAHLPRAQGDRIIEDTPVNSPHPFFRLAVDCSPRIRNHVRKPTPSTEDWSNIAPSLFSSGPVVRHPLPPKPLLPLGRIPLSRGVGPAFIPTSEYTLYPDTRWNPSFRNVGSSRYPERSEAHTGAGFRIGQDHVAVDGIDPVVAAREARRKVVYGPGLDSEPPGEVDEEDSAKLTEAAIRRFSGVKSSVELAEDTGFEEPISEPTSLRSKQASPADSIPLAIAPPTLSSGDAAESTHRDEFAPGAYIPPSFLAEHMVTPPSYD